MNCPSCSFANPPDARFCLNCGTKLEVAALPEGERRFVTVLFADVVGSTAIGEQIDPEEVAEIMHGAFSVFNAAVDRYGGTVTRLMGDAVLAIFGAPVAHEEDPERAIRAGLAILDDSRAYAERVLRGYNIDFQVRVGIHSGLAVLAMVGDEIKTEYTAMGDTANVASRLQNAATPGTVLISSDTNHLVKSLFETQPHGPLELKGKSRPVETFEVLSARASRDKVRGLEGISSPLVGREREQEVLQQRVEAIIGGSGSLAAIVGEAGLGKSRLVAELRHSVTARAEPVQWLEGRALSYGQTIAYYPWRQIVRQALGISETDPAEEQRDLVRGSVILPDVPFFERMLSIEGGDTLEALRSLRGDEVRSRLTDAVRRFLESRSTDEPLILVFDDLHWSDEPSLELLAGVSNLVELGRILILCILRPDRVASSWEILERIRRVVGERFVELELEPLDASASRQLLGNLLHVEDLPDSVRALILAKSDGNPFFIEEVIRALIDSGHIVQEGDRWRATSDITDVAIPDTLSGVLSARIDRLPEKTKRVVQTAAVIGRIFEYLVLSETCTTAPLPERIDDASPHVDTLTEEGLVRERARDPELEYIFKHALTQEAAYELLLLRRRKLYHRRVGEVLERIHAAQIDDMAPVLAHHFWQSEDWDRCSQYCLRAATSAAKVYAMREAVEHFDRAYQALSRMSDAPPEQVIDAALAWAEFAAKFRPFQEVVDRLREIEPRARDLGDVRRIAQVLNRIGNVYVSAGYPTKGMLPLTESFRLAEELGDELLGLLPLFMTTEGMVDSNPRAAIPALDHVIELSEKYDRPDIQAHALAMKALAHSRLGEFQEAMLELMHAHEVLKLTDVLVKHADVNSISALVYLDMGDIERSLEHGQLATEQGIKAGAGDCTVFAMYSCALGNLRKPDLPAVEDLIQRSLLRLPGLDSEYLEYVLHGGLAVARSLADDEAAIPQMEAVLANARALGDDYTAGLMTQALANALTRFGDLARADTYLESALQYYRGNEMKPYLVRTLQTLASLRALQGRDKEARAAGEEAERLNRELTDAVARLDLAAAAV